MTGAEIYANCGVYASFVIGAWGAVAGVLIGLAVVQRWPALFGLKRGA